MSQVQRDHYRFGSYIGQPRFISFWHQINETLAFNPANVLEVGPGPGIVTDIIRKQGVPLTTLDYAEDVGADVIGSVLALPFADGAFDIIICCQVLEHLPYEQFEKALSEIRRVSRKGAVISLPHAGRLVLYDGYFPIFGRVRFAIPRAPKNKEHVFDGQHYWELGKNNYPVGRIKTDMLKHFARVRNFRLRENAYHHFFICNNG